jgi:hypothetical protein
VRCRSKAAFPFFPDGGTTATASRSNGSGEPLQLKLKVIAMAENHPSESPLEQSHACSAEERKLFRKLSRRLWAIGLGLCVVAAGTAVRAYSLIAVSPLATDQDAGFEGNREGYGNALIAVWAILTAFRTLKTALRASGATRARTDARSAMFALLSDLTAELRWLSILLFLLVLGVVVAFVLIAGVSFVG